MNENQNKKKKNKQRESHVNNTESVENCRKKSKTCKEDEQVLNFGFDTRLYSRVGSGVQRINVKLSFLASLDEAKSALARAADRPSDAKRFTIRFRDARGWNICRTEAQWSAEKERGRQYAISMSRFVPANGTAPDVLINALGPKLTAREKAQLEEERTAAFIADVEKSKLTAENNASTSTTTTAKRRSLRSRTKKGSD